MYDEAERKRCLQSTTCFVALLAPSSVFIIGGN
jgi:hypothetical protein